eukprot:scaffold625_cov420-Prasinococcus_capsulatus_cf.AAC.48
MIQNLVRNVLSNPRIWCLAFCYFAIYIVRSGVTNWTVFFLMNAKGVADATTAALNFSTMEIGGLAGSLVAGRVSDSVIKANPEAGATGMRIKVVMVYTVGIALALSILWKIPPSLDWAQPAAIFLIGFFLYGPQMLIGLCGAEIVGPKSVGASEGFLGWIAYLVGISKRVVLNSVDAGVRKLMSHPGRWQGAANAGLPLASIVNTYGWNAFFVTLIGACVLALVLLAPLVTARSHGTSLEETVCLQSLSFCVLILAAQREADALLELKAA